MSPDAQALLHDLEGVESARLDPYLLWALLSDFKGFGRHLRPTDRIPFVVETPYPGGPALLAEQRASRDDALVAMAASYRRDPHTRYCTVSVALRDVPAFLRSEHVTRAEMGLPNLEVDAALASSIGGGGARPPADDGTPFVGVIDHGIAFLNRSFRRAGAPRVLRFWDQWAGLGGSPAPVQPHWSPVPEYGYGRQLQADDIAALLAGGRSEDELYRALDYAPVYGRAAHGTHVLDVAAGVPNPLAALGAGNGAELPIVAVQLPWEPEKDVSGASLGVHVLDGLRYILDVAGARRNVVVNLSDGALAGSHNGGSIVEAALDELLERPGLSIVIAAGNAYREQGHAEGEIGPLRSAVLGWNVRPDDHTENFLEIWFPSGADARVELDTPGGERAFDVRLGASRVWPRGAEVAAAGIHLREVSNGRGQMALLALRPARPANTADPTAPHGTWRVSIENLERRPIRFEAWIERDDPPYGEHSPRRQSRFVDLGGAWISARNTLNSLATGRQPVVVGGYRLSDGALADYTAAGGQAQPTVVAPSDEAATLPGLRAAGNRSGSTVRISGTSVATPIVTRVIAEALATAPRGQLYTCEQIKQSLRVAADANAREQTHQSAVHRVGAEPGTSPGDPADEALRAGSGRLHIAARLRLP